MTQTRQDKAKHTAKEDTTRQRQSRVQSEIYANQKSSRMTTKKYVYEEI